MSNSTPRVPPLPGSPLRLSWAALTFASTACSTLPPEPPVHLSFAMSGEECRFETEGRSMSLKALTAAASAWRRRGVHLDATPATPYKCLGGAIFALQRAGVKRIGWIAEPPPAEEEK
jgi:hypothetical protein